jgi:uncharacterized protein YutE (UPF0331/DUF86 family)
VVDEERITRLLDRMLADVAELRSLAARGEGSLLDDRTALGAVKYGFVVSIEGCARIAHHILVSEGWSAPESNADAFGELAEHGVVDVDVSARLARAAGFRNVLVHEYVDVDDRIVVENLERLADLEDFAACVAAWMRDRTHKD